MLIKSLQEITDEKENSQLHLLILRKGEVYMSSYINDVMDIADALHQLTQSMKNSTTRANMLERISHYAEIVT